MKVFTVKLNREELAALAVFKPELKQILDDYDNNYNAFVDNVLKLTGTLKYLTNFSCRGELSKLKLLNNLLYDYFFLDSTKEFISEFILDNSDYCKFISYIDSIYSIVLYLIDTIEYEIRDEFPEYDEAFKEYFDKINSLNLCN
jgi:hypothetical protein